jgi:hypothetical protein
LWLLQHVSQLKGQLLLLLTQAGGSNSSAEPAGPAALASWYHSHSTLCGLVTIDQGSGSIALSDSHLGNYCTCARILSLDRPGSFQIDNNSKPVVFGALFEWCMRIVRWLKAAAEFASMCLLQLFY